MLRLRFPLLLALLAASCGLPKDQMDSRQSPILGGSSASVGQFPTVVAVVNAGLCTGTLVAPDLVVTAAHCVSPSVLGYYTQSQVTNDTVVILDSTNINGYGGTAIQAADTLPHPSFNVNSLGRHDIGLIWLVQSVTDRTPTALNRTYDDAPAGITTTLVGFGLTDPMDENSYGHLYYLPNKNSVACSSLGESDAYLLCYDQSDGTGSCSGDSGGPSFATIGGIEKIVGVTSFGDQYCQQLGAYTRIDAEIDFLEANAPELVCVEETCDGVDNDCDGQVDEELGSTTCGVGACQVTVANCVDGVEQTCTPGAPSDETCNGLDDDCDGQVDEELGNTTCGVGACQVTVQSCVDGVPQTCTPGTPSDETCNGIDDDCDGTVDEDDVCSTDSGGCGCRTGARGAASTDASLLLVGLVLLAGGIRARRSRGR